MVENHTSLTALDAIVSLSRRVLDDVKAAIKSPYKQSSKGILIDIDPIEVFLNPIKELFEVDDDMEISFHSISGFIIHKGLSNVIDLIRGTELLPEAYLGSKALGEDYMVLSIGQTIVAVMMACGIRKLRTDLPPEWQPTKKD